MIIKNKVLRMMGFLIAIACLSACNKNEENLAPQENNAPTVANSLPDLSLNKGFGTQTVDLANVFTDADQHSLTLTAISSNTATVTISVSNTTLTITEVAEGNSVITVTADDGNGGTVSDNFNCVVSDNTACSVDNTITTSLSECRFTAQQANLTASYSETVANNVRTIVTNNVPNHTFGSPPDKIMAVQSTWTMTSVPAKASQVTPVISSTRLEYVVGVALNGVKMDPGANFPYENTSTGEMNYEWVLEATTNTTTTTLDCNQAHLQPDGGYHYHGDFKTYADALGVDGTKMVQVGWAADGFPIYYKYAYTDASNAGSAVKEMTSSYQIKSGDRPGDGISAPCGAYNGKYEADFEYVAGKGDLDECNGRFGVTPEFPGGTYYYVITTDYPIIPRCFSGTPDASFKIGR
ncbi:MAG TPA: hypothetical protein DCS93_07700 [Microscillaceae bacterium]|nr:hypothetical protein [Microscillaceae bacterium]